MRRRENVSSASACSAARPRMSSATRLSLRGLVRIEAAKAIASLSPSRRSAAFLPMLFPLRLSIRGMAIEDPGRRELAEFVTDHILGHQHRNKLVAVVDAEGQADELRQNGRAPRPGLDDLLASRIARLLRLLQEIAVDERTFPNRTRHSSALLLLEAPAHDQLARGLVLARALALGLNTPRRHRMAPALGAALAAAVRMIDWVHRDAAHDGATTLPARAAGLVGLFVGVVRIRDRTDRREALRAHHAHLARTELEERITRIAPDELHIAARGARELAALADLHFHIVHDRADGNARKRHRIAGFDVLAFPRDHGIPGLEALGSQDVGQFAVRVADERDECRAVRVVFEPLDDRRHAPFGAAHEVDHAVAALMPATLLPRRDVTVIVPPTRADLPLGQALDRLALPELRAV